MHKLLRIPCLLLLLAFAAPAEAAKPYNPSSWALGFTLGEPTGVSAKHWFGGANALDLGLGFGHGLRLQADYLFGLTRLARDRGFGLDLYGGLGGAISTGHGYCGWLHDHHHCDDGDPALGLRVPFGLDFLIRSASLELGLEIAPGLWVGPDHFHELLDFNLFLRFLL